MAVFESILLYLWETLKLWLFTIFAAPFKNFDMLWILIPIYMAWFFAEFFQEKVGTSMGNAISNSVIVFWGGFDWMRNTIMKITSGTLAFGWNAIGRIILSVLLVGYGILIIVLGLKGNKLIKYIGRIREVTYLVVMFTPIFYDVMEISWQHILSIIIFFPIFYFAIELMDKYMPNPKAIVADMEEASGGSSGSSGSSSFGGDMGGGTSTEPFGSSSSDPFGKSSGMDTKGMGDFKL